MVDMVIPYVNGNDKEWQRCIDKYIKDYHLIENRHGTRFNDIGLFSYQLRLIKKYMPFIRTLHILVSNLSQLDNVINDLPPNTHIVLHSEFIPKKYLPTFNSCTIEMFLWNIPNLAEEFIYANDDMLPIAPLKETDFFTPSGKLKISWKLEDITKCNSQFRQVCYKQYQEIKSRVLTDNHEHKFSKEHYFRPLHSFTPMIKSHCKTIYDNMSNVIEKQISPFRTRYNYNQYIYPLYELLCLKNTLPSKLSFAYTEIKMDSNEVVEELKKKHHIICINDNRMSMVRKIDTKGIYEELERRLR